MRNVQNFFRYQEYKDVWYLVLFAIPASIGGAIGFVFLGNIGAVVCAVVAYVAFAVFSYKNVRFYRAWAGLTSRITKMTVVLLITTVFIVLVFALLSILFGTKTTKVVSDGGQYHLAFAEVYA
ncbi:hypothetical protein [Rhabdaerophilum sp. SD176]|uniref:hypothetical protein n=1 Tax=Rhabdaerophilum sp. SD176 TaxID=2983548 RepID=UPI0024DFCBF8|nr:hypothetical protein [Rhabdaerophilum sp. SD176]